MYKKDDLKFIMMENGDLFVQSISTILLQESHAKNWDSKEKEKQFMGMAKEVIQ